MTPAPLVRPDDHSTLSFTSSTLNWRNARRKPTPDGNLCPTLLTTVTRAESVLPSLRTSPTVTTAVRLTAWSSIAFSAVGIESMPESDSIGSVLRMPRMSGNCHAILSR